ncbi:MAG: metal dependent phosphohydrolase [Gemmatimonadetes bacterium]|nr:metal dependent phosphohydrolase [Gemmatimonadota bacterium]
MKPLLIVALGRTISAAPLGRRGDDVEVRHVPVLPTASTLDNERPTVIALDAGLLASIGDDRPRLEDLARCAAIVGIGSAGETEPASNFPLDLLSGWVPGDAPTGAILAQLRGGFRHAASLVAERRAKHEEALRHGELNELSRVGVALSTERDLTTLLEMIVTQARRITCADAGSLLLVDRKTDPSAPEGTLRFKISQNFSLPNLPFSEFTVPITHSSLSGYAASTGEPLVIADVYLLPDNVSYKQNRSFDEKFGYRTKSMLVIPMKTHRDEVVGVLQLINRKKDDDVVLATAEIVDREVESFNKRSIEMVTALASQAAVAIENSFLYEDIERLFEGFVTAAVTAIESRDPTTSGHSSRVALLTVGLAEAVDRAGEGSYKLQTFTREQLKELRYASLLHDFGKVGVREQVLVKQKKLYGPDLDLIKHRFAYLLQASDLQFERERANYVLTHGLGTYEPHVKRLDEMRMAKREELQRFMDAIVKANEPTVLPEGSFEALSEINQRTYLDFDGVTRPLLHDDELKFLMIRKGNLDDQERREIESHVTHTFRFLEQIPWTGELRNIPSIAHAHHEKLNGKGYPRQIGAEEIPVQAKMMTISDIFDALTATDRPYKRAVPTERALDILGMEAKDGMLDKELLETFVKAGVFRVVGGE